MTKSKGINKPKKTWSELETKLFFALYPCTKSEALSVLFGCTVKQIYSRAKNTNVKKSQWFKDSPMSSRLKRGDEVGKAHRFQPGNVPRNKGIKGMPSHPNQIPTQFKPGQRSKNWRPVGSTRIDSDGYVQIKMAEGKFKWKFLHRVVWERMNGPIGRDFVMSFIDGNKLNCKITNLTLITKAQNAINNSIHRFGPELAAIYMIKGQITRHINRREKNDARHRAA